MSYIAARQTWLDDYIPDLGTVQRLDTSRSDESRAQQQSALDALRAIVDAEGLTDADRVTADAIARRALGARMQALADVRQQMGARGIRGSGVEALAALQGQSDDANAQSVALAQEALRRRLDAISTSGELAGTMRQQDVDVAARQAQIINDFEARRAQTLNAARQFNTSGRQAVERDNTTAANQMTQLAGQDRLQRDINTERLGTTRDISRNELENQRILSTDRNTTAVNIARDQNELQREINSSRDLLQRDLNRDDMILERERMNNNLRLQELGAQSIQDSGRRQSNTALIGAGLNFLGSNTGSSLLDWLF